MEMGYAVKGKYKGDAWRSEIFFDAQEMNEKHQECLDRQLPPPNQRFGRGL